MFHSEFAALQCLSFWYPSSADYSRRQNISTWKLVLHCIESSLHHDLPHAAVVIFHWVHTPLTAWRGHYSQLWPEIYPSWLLMLGWGSGLDSQEKVLQAIYVFFLKRNRLLLSCFTWNALFGWTVLLFTGRNVNYETVHAYKHLFISSGIIGHKVNNQTYKRLKRNHH